MPGAVLHTRLSASRQTVGLAAPGNAQLNRPRRIDPRRQGRPAAASCPSPAPTGSRPAGEIRSTCGYVYERETMRAQVPCRCGNDPPRSDSRAERPRWNRHSALPRHDRDDAHVLDRIPCLQRLRVRPGETSSPPAVSPRDPPAQAWRASRPSGSRAGRRLGRRCLGLGLRFRIDGTRADVSEVHADMVAAGRAGRASTQASTRCSRSCTTPMVSWCCSCLQDVRL